MTICFEPFRPMNVFFYLRDDKFHTKALDDLLGHEGKFGFIVMDGKGTLFGTLRGNTGQVFYMYRLFRPKKHGIGGVFPCSLLKVY